MRRQFSHHFAVILFYTCMTSLGQSCYGGNWWFKWFGWFWLSQIVGNISGVHTHRLVVDWTKPATTVKYKSYSCPSHTSHSSNSSSTAQSVIMIFILVNIALVASLPTEIPSYDEEVDTRIVNREEEQRSDIAGSLVSDVKQINVLLNIPNNCNANTIYDDMIRQINNCKTGSDRGHPNLKSGCLLQIDFTRLKTDCQNSKLSFPKDAENIWHPSPSCNGGYCQ